MVRVRVFAWGSGHWCMSAFVGRFPVEIGQADGPFSPVKFG